MKLALDRVAVGEHILLGGDNMDLALARTIEQQLLQKGTKLDGLQLHALWHNCRVAKEKMLEPGSKTKEEPVTILGKGTGLVGGTIKAKLLRSDLEAILRDGFFPETASGDMPQRQRRIGLQEIGLPYAADAAITKHLARFLRQGESGTLAAPTHVLFNGGVFHAGMLRERVISVLNAWLKEEGKPAVKPLSGEDLMHAVARGATYLRSGAPGREVRIRSGVPRTLIMWESKDSTSRRARHPESRQGLDRRAFREWKRGPRPSFRIASLAWW